MSECIYTRVDRRDTADERLLSKALRNGTPRPTQLHISLAFPRREARPARQRELTLLRTGENSRSCTHRKKSYPKRTRTPSKVVAGGGDGDLENKVHVDVHLLGDLEYEMLATEPARSDGPVLVQVRVLEDPFLVR